MLDPSGKQRWVIKETHTKREKLFSFFGFEHIEERTITTELASVALGGVAGSRVILPLASAKALLDRDFNQNYGDDQRHEGPPEALLAMARVTPQARNHHRGQHHIEDRKSVV